MPRTLYRCDLCGQEHATETGAVRCEDSHQKVVEVLEHKINARDDNGRYPTTIVVKMADGARFEYRKHARAR